MAKNAYYAKIDLLQKSPGLVDSIYGGYGFSPVPKKCDFSAQTREKPGAGGTSKKPHLQQTV